MRDYRAYILAIDGHRFVWAKGFLTDHPNDAAAVDAAKQITHEHEVEVWEGCRLVARLRHGEEEMSPGLVPALLSICEKDSAGRAERISLGKVSELASAISAEGNLFLRADNQQFVAETSETPITSEKSEDSRESGSKPDPGPAGWWRFLIS